MDPSASLRMTGLVDMTPVVSKHEPFAFFLKKAGVSLCY